MNLLRKRDDREARKSRFVVHLVVSGIPLGGLHKLSVLLELEASSNCPFFLIFVISEVTKRNMVKTKSREACRFSKDLCNLEARYTSQSRRCSIKH